MTIPRSTSARVTIIVLAVAVLLSGLYFARESGTDPEVYGNDFNVYYHAAREVIAGRDPYQRSLGDWTPYIYPPLFAELMVPFALLPLPVAAYIWFLISAASIVGAAWMSVSLATRTSELESGVLKQAVAEAAWWKAVTSAVTVVVVLRFVLDTFNLGQVNALVAGLAVAHVYLYARGRKALSALALVIAVSIKLTPAVLILYHIAKLRVRFAVACLALLIAVSALSFLPFGGDSVGAFRVFVNRTLKNEQGYDFAYAGNQSLRGAIARFQDGAKEPLSPNDGSRKPAEAVTLMISILLLLLAAFTAVRAQNELAAAAPIFCCVVLLSPLSWKAHYVMLVLPVGYLVSRMRTSVRSRTLITATLATTFALFNLTSPRVIGLSPAEWADAHSLVLAGSLLIYVACIASAREKAINLSPSDRDSP